jgi:hypothetical protein
LIIQKVAASTNIISRLAGGNGYWYDGDGGPASSCTLTAVYAISLDGQKQNLYLTDNLGGLRAINLATNIIINIATYSYLNIPSYTLDAVFADAIGNVYFSERGKIRKINLATKVLTTIAGTGVNGYNGDGIAATNAQINGVISLFVDSFNNVFFCDISNNRVRKIDFLTSFYYYYY